MIAVPSSGALATNGAPFQALHTLPLLNCLFSSFCELLHTFYRRDPGVAHHGYAPGDPTITPTALLKCDRVIKRSQDSQFGDERWKLRGHRRRIGGRWEVNARGRIRNLGARGGGTLRSESPQHGQRPSCEVAAVASARNQ